MARQQAARGIADSSSTSTMGGSGCSSWRRSLSSSDSIWCVSSATSEAEGGRTALDGVGAAEDAVELFVVGVASRSQVEQHLLHLIQVLAASSKKIW
jgi:hypothetical protein